MRQSATFPVPDLKTAKTQLLYWSAGCHTGIYLDHNSYLDADGSSGWEVLAAAGAVQALSAPAGTAFEALKTLQQQTGDWLFGVFSYDLKNEVERLVSGLPDAIGLPDLLFFQPEAVAGIRNGQLEIHSIGKTPDLVWAEIGSARPPEFSPAWPQLSDALQPRMPRQNYLETVEAIRQHIVEGDLYEMNLCQEFFAEQVSINPIHVWEKLNALTKAPMSAFFRVNGQFLLSASPERFLKKTGDKLISQPIKGTRRRDAQRDAALRDDLQSSEKDRAENVMIVDLVRNDLARCCRPGTVRVDELFGIYSFKTVHQMISTVSGQLRPEVHPIDALKAAFPPGSMTGAPKVMAMQLIEQYEKSRRGWYSGALGFFEPNGDFDFNVLIRSILYNASRGNVSAHVGGAIVYDSDPQAEYEECLVKAHALFRALEI